MTVEVADNHFDLFDLPVVFEIDRKRLDERYRELQRITHPDRFASAGERERRIAMQQATRVNEAYQVLKDPLRRGFYLLELAGMPADARQHTTRDSAFLMQQMELREALEAVRLAGDPFAALDGVLDRIADDSAQLTTRLAGLLQAAEGDSLEAALEVLTRMQFYRRLQDEANEMGLLLEEQQA